MIHGRKSTRSGRWLLLASFVAGVVGGTTAARAQSPNQFGGQDRAEAASRMIVLGVQQGISSLPPTSGQSFTYEFDPTLATYVSSEQLGPTALRSPQTVGANKFSVRVAGSYFELADTVQPIPFLLSIGDANQLPAVEGVAKIGLQANAHVGLVNIGGSYGITDGIEMTLNLPVVIVDANASQIFSTDFAALGFPPNEAPLSGPCIGLPEEGCLPDVSSAVDFLNQELHPSGLYPLRKESFKALRFAFNEGTQAGVGRISIGGKGLLYADKLLQVALAPEFFFPSPNEDEFAGSDSAAILPRVIAALRLTEPLSMHLDVGYDYDFDSDELRRFVWNTGVSLAIARATFDVGIGGSKFNQGIQWTPYQAPFVSGFSRSMFPLECVPNSADCLPGTITALGDTRLGSNFIDALGGIKVRVAGKTVLSGTVNVPLNNEGFRAAAVGTVAVEQYF
jgi:hypothetical protein